MRRMVNALGAVLLGLLLAAGLASAQTAADSATQVAPAASPELAPGGRPGNNAPFWREVRSGQQGFVSIPNKSAGTLVQSDGESWRNFRNGLYRTWAGYILLGTVALLSLFFALRGRIGIEQGRSGHLIERFSGFERFVHWMTAICFIVLALTGLNMVFGRYLVLPLLGKATFAALTMWGKLAHDFLAFAFMTGLALMFVLWVAHNIPNRHDLVWLAKGGGMLGGHPPARKFNAGQKLIFWAVSLGGLSLSLSGLQLIFPFTFHFFNDTFALLNHLGLGLPTDLTPMQEQQLAAVWHGSMAFVLIAVMIAHVYIGTLGMEGAFEAMGTGEVDLNWAREHHDLWVEELERRGEVRVPAE
jgi:formate dehydrogenase subunit gamma